MFALAVAVRMAFGTTVSQGEAVHGWGLLWLVPGGGRDRGAAALTVADRLFAGFLGFVAVCTVWDNVKGAAAR